MRSKDLKEPYLEAFEFIINTRNDIVIIESAEITDDVEGLTKYNEIMNDFLSPLEEEEIKDAIRSLSSKNKDIINKVFEIENCCDDEISVDVLSDIKNIMIEMWSYAVDSLKKVLDGSEESMESMDSMESVMQEVSKGVDTIPTIPTMKYETMETMETNEAPWGAALAVGIIIICLFLYLIFMRRTSS